MEIDYKAIAHIVEDKARVYMLKGGYISIRVYTRNYRTLDTLRVLGTVHKHREGVRVWNWTRQAEMREHLPKLVKHMDNIDRYILFVHIYRWSVASEPSKTKLFGETKVLLPPKFVRDLATQPSYDGYGSDLEPWLDQVDHVRELQEIERAERDEQ